jgi:hypothetical protein
VSSSLEENAISNEDAVALAEALKVNNAVDYIR